jgi:hypothetical protein
VLVPFLDLINHRRLSGVRACSHTCVEAAHMGARVHSEPVLARVRPRSPRVRCRRAPGHNPGWQAGGATVLRERGIRPVTRTRTTRAQIILNRASRDFVVGEELFNTYSECAAAGSVAISALTARSDKPSSTIWVQYGFVEHGSALDL